MIPKKVTLPKQKKFHDSKFLFFFFNYCIYQGWGGSIAIRSSQFFLEFFSLSLGIQYTLYMDAKFHKRDAVAIYRQLYKDNFSCLIHSYIKIEYKFVRTTAIHVYCESLTVGQQYTYMMVRVWILIFAIFAWRILYKIKFKSCILWA